MGARHPHRRTDQVRLVTRRRGGPVVGRNAGDDPRVVEPDPPAGQRRPSAGQPPQRGADQDVLASVPPPHPGATRQPPRGVLVVAIASAQDSGPGGDLPLEPVDLALQQQGLGLQLGGVEPVDVDGDHLVDRLADPEYPSPVHVFESTVAKHNLTTVRRC